MAAACAVLDGGRHLLLEGPVGSGKTTLAAAACRRLGRRTIRVDGDDRFSEDRLAGWFDPPLVLRLGYGEGAFVAGPLVRAMREGGVLFLNELNRLPEAAQNLLLPALDEGLVEIPHLGEVRAAEGFQVVATQNPAEYVATGHLSEALRDRFEHLMVGYQTAPEEEQIVAAATGCADTALVRAAVRVVRGTRLHPRVRRGASVRGAIAMVELAAAREGAAPLALRVRSVAETALATRVDLREADAVLDDVLDELVELVVEQGADPDAVAAEVWGRAAQGASGGAPETRSDGGEQGGPSRPPEPLACTLEDRRALAEQLRAAPEELDGWELAGDLSAGALSYAGERVYLCAQQLAAAAVLQRAARLVGPLKAATSSPRAAARAVGRRARRGGRGREPARQAAPGARRPHRAAARGPPAPGGADDRHVAEHGRGEDGARRGRRGGARAQAAARRPQRGAVRRRGPHGAPLRRGGRAGRAGPPHARRAVRRRDGHRGRAPSSGHAELQRGRDPGRCGLLVSDGVYTCGADPLPAGGALRRAPRAADGGAPGAARSGRAGDHLDLARLAVGEPIARAADGGVVPSTASPTSRAACSRWPTVCCAERMLPGGERTPVSTEETHVSGRPDEPEELVERALAAGASDAAVLRPDQVVTAEWVRMKCLYGVRPAGRCLTCPPHSPTPAETRRLLDEYETILLLRFDVRRRRAPSGSPPAAGCTSTALRARARAVPRRLLQGVRHRRRALVRARRGLRHAPRPATAASGLRPGPRAAASTCSPPAPTPAGRSKWCSAPGEPYHRYALVLVE